MSWHDGKFTKLINDDELCLLYTKVYRDLKKKFISEGKSTERIDKIYNELMENRLPATKEITKVIVNDVLEQLGKPLLS